MASIHRINPHAIVCAALTLLFTLLCWFATASKSPTYDESQHSLAAWAALHHADFRLDAEDPPLWMYWAALPNRAVALKADFTAPGWTNTPAWSHSRWEW